MSTVWITGAGGLIGSYLAKTASRFAPHFRVVALTRPDMELTDFAAVERKFKSDRPTLVIHCAALSRSPECQGNPKLAEKLNVHVTAHLAALACEEKFVFFSSDLVFDGKKSWYTEADDPNPVMVYGENKATAEQIVLKNPRHVVVRTSLNSGLSPKGRGAFNEELCYAWREGRTVKLFTDEYRCPIPAFETAHAVWELALRKETGLFHLAGAERLSRLQIGELVASRHPELKCKIEPGSLREYQGAPRPADVSLNCEKLQNLLSFPLPSFIAWTASAQTSDL